MLVESIDHLPHIVEPIKKGWQLNIGVAYSCTNILKPLPWHVLRQPEGRAFKHINRLLRPPHFVVLNPLKSCLKEVTAHPDIEILEVRIRAFNIFVRHHYGNLQNKFSGKHIRKRSKSDIYPIKLKLWFFHPPFASLMYESPLLWKVVAVTLSSCTPSIWFSFFSEGRFSGSQSSLSTLTPCRRSSAISFWLAPWPILLLVFSFDTLASWLLSG